MTVVTEYDADDRIVVGYFAKCANASRAIDELIDEGFEISTLGAAMRVAQTETNGLQGDGERRAWMREIFREGAASGAGKRTTVIRIASGEGSHLPEFEYSELSFENSFMGMGLSLRDARLLSAALSSGGAVVSVSPGRRASLAEGILERNHGGIRFDGLAASGELGDTAQVEIYGRMHNYYRPEESIRRKAS
jgi:hypothetical protein